MISEGIILVDKGFGLTSFETVSQVKKIIGAHKAGHTGTLDPHATGLLIIALNKATKITGLLSADNKLYRAKIKLGESRSSYDRFSRITDQSDVNVNASNIEAELSDFIGEFRQIIPLFSAVHFEGKRMYEYAREGKEIPVKYGQVEIYNIETIGYHEPILEIEVSCSGGTYIRSLAHQLGQKLRCGAHLYSLKRLCIGKFKVEDAHSIGQLKAMVALGNLEKCILKLQNTLDLPFMIIDDAKMDGIRNGQDIKLEDITELEKDFKSGELIGIKDGYGKLLALGTACISSEEIRQKSAGIGKLFEYKRVI